MRRVSKRSAWIRAVVVIGTSALVFGCEGGAEQASEGGPGDDTSEVPTPEADAPAPGAPEVTSPLDPATPEDTADPEDAPPPPRFPAAGEWITDELRVPRAIHMSWQRDAGHTLTFVWTTTDTRVEGYTPRVWVGQPDEGRSEEALLPVGEGRVHEGFGIAYQEMLFGVPYSDDVHMVWQVEVTGLEPRADYVFRVGSWSGVDSDGRLLDPNLSAPLAVRSAPAKGDREPFAFVMAGDSRSGTDEIRLHAERLGDIDVVGWFYNGDMTEVGTQPEWDDWFDAMAPILERRPLMSVAGNHEIFHDVYYSQMALPQNPELPEALRERAWSITVGNVHFIGLDSNDPAVVQQQIPWLEAEIASAKADPDIDWVISMAHHPAYSAAKHGSTSYIQQHWVPVFEAQGLDISFSGHDHNYERSHPVRDGAVVDAGEGVVYIVAGGFFAPAYGNGSEWWTATSTHGNQRNYVVAQVHGGTLEITAYSGDGQTVLDHYTLTKPASR